MPVALSNITRQDSFSDYIALTAFQANTLESRAAIASGRGSDTKLDTWFVPMPQQLSRITTHNYSQVETSFAYTLSKLAQPAGSRTTGMGPIDKGVQGLIGAAKKGLAQQGTGVVGDLAAMGTAVAANAATKLATGALGAVDMLRSQATMATDQPAIGMSNQELMYTGSVERNYTLAYDFVAKDAADIYGETGILSIIAQLEAYSFPKSYEDSVSNRDLIAVPPIWRMDHALVDTSSGNVSISAESAPLAYLGQPKLLVLYNVTAVHDTTSVALDGGGNTYPLRTSLTLTFKEMEPVVRVEGSGSDIATYGEISAPKLMCRSEIYSLQEDG